jgi:thiol:disulfide interchange protein
MIKIIKFGANWCTPCRVYENILKEVKVDHPEVEIKEVNVEDESDEVTALVNKYHVRNIPLTVFQFSDGSEQLETGLLQRNRIEEILNSDAKCQN